MSFSLRKFVTGILLKVTTYSSAVHDKEGAVYVEDDAGNKIKTYVDGAKKEIITNDTLARLDYDNTTSGLVATDPQAAIDEVDGNVDTIGADLDTAELAIIALEADAHTHINKALLDTYTQTEVDLADAVAKKHEHLNKALLDTYTQTEVDLADAVAKKHEHLNKALLDTYTQTEVDIADAVAKKHEHLNKALLDTYDQTNADITSAITNSHTHLNKALLDTYTQTEVDLADAVAKKHEHTNKAVLDATTASFLIADETKLDNIETATATYTNKTFDDAISQQEIAKPTTPPAGYMKLYPKSDGNYYQLDDAGTETALVGGSGGTLDDANLLSNVGLSFAVGAGAATIGLTQKDGTTDASALEPISIAFRSSTLTSGAYVLRSITSALSMTITALATLNTTSAFRCRFYVYAIDNAGAVELAVCRFKLSEDLLYTTTAMSAAASEYDVLYSTSARAGVAIRLLGHIESTQATAGTWASTADEIFIGNSQDEIGMFQALGGTTSLTYNSGVPRVVEYLAPTIDKGGVISSYLSGVSTVGKLQVFDITISTNSGTEFWDRATMHFDLYIDGVLESRETWVEKNISTLTPFSYSRNFEINRRIVLKEGQTIGAYFTQSTGSNYSWTSSGKLQIMAYEPKLSNG